MRTILHVDMDAFYVSVELRRHPELQGLPVVVGGTGGRGVVAAASYEARRFGVHSALSSAIARRRCPQAVFLPGDLEHYQEVSAEVRAVFDRYTPLVEPLALDEAFLDVTGATNLFGSGRQIADRIRREIDAELGLGCSVGVATNKFVAKVASVAAKPVARPEGVTAGVGVVEVPPGGERAFLAPLPVERVWGVGPVTLGHLHDLGIRTVADLAAASTARLRRRLGPAASEQLVLLAQGRDDRPVEPDRAARSIGNEETYADDLTTADQVGRELVRLADAVSARLRGAGTPARTITLKVRYSNFRTITRSFTSARPIDTAASILAGLEPIVAALEVSPGIRLLGLSAANLGSAAEQLELFGEAERDEERRTARTIDDIRTRFGRSAIGHASTLDTSRPAAAGSRPWGPDRDAAPPRSV